MADNDRKISLTGKTALITGGAIRVGAVIAGRLAEAGVNLILHFNSNADAATATANSLRGKFPALKILTVQGDLSDPEAIGAMISKIEREMPPVDILINSASVFYPTPLREVSLSDWNKIMDINLRAPFLLSQHFGFKMKEIGFGRVINILDCNIKRHYRSFAPYLVSKNALAALTEILAIELGPEVTVNGVAPGTVLVPDGSSPEYKDLALKRVLTGNHGAPEDVANMVAFLLEYGKFITGSIHYVDGGASIRP